MTRISIVLIDETRKMTASVEINGGIDVLTVIKHCQDVVYVSHLMDALRRILAAHPRGITYKEHILTGNQYLPSTLELVFGCPMGVGYAPIENITSDYILVLNQSDVGVRINQYCGDYKDVEPCEMLVFDGSVESIVVCLE